LPNLNDFISSSTIFDSKAKTDVKSSSEAGEAKGEATGGLSLAPDIKQKHLLRKNQIPNQTTTNKKETNLHNDQKQMIIFVISFRLKEASLHRKNRQQLPFQPKQ
jgi:hypothetical protein